MTSHGLPANLVAREGDAHVVHHGFKAMQITASALTAEALKLTMPASVFSRSTESHNQDKVSMGSIAARDCQRVLELTETVAIVELLALCQAVDLRGSGELQAPQPHPARRGAGAGPAHRRRSPPGRRHQRPAGALSPRRAADRNRRQRHPNDDPGHTRPRRLRGVAAADRDGGAQAGRARRQTQAGRARRREGARRHRCAAGGAVEGARALRRVSARRSTSRCCRRPWSARGASTSRRPSRFARHTEKPIESVMIIDGNQLQFGTPTARRA